MPFVGLGKVRMRASALSKRKETKRNETKRGGMLALQRAPVVSLQLACLFLCVFARNHGKRPSVSVPADAAATKTDGKMKVCFYYVASTPAPVFVSSLFRGDVPRAVRFGSGKFKVRFFLKKKLIMTYDHDTVALPLPPAPCTPIGNTTTASFFSFFFIVCLTFFFWTPIASIASSTTAGMKV